MDIHTPADAFSAQHRLLRYLLTAPDAVRSRTQFVRVLRSGSDPLPDEWTQADIDAGFQHLRSEVGLAEGQVVLVTADALDLIDEALTQMPDEVLLAADLPFDGPFMLWLETPLPYHPVTYDEDGNLVQERWDVRSIGVQQAPATVRLPDEGRIVDGCVLYVYADLGDRYYGWDTGDVVLMDRLGVAYDSDWSSHAETPSRRLHSWLIAALRLVGQHLEVERQRPPRQALRAVQRAGGTIPHDGYISVLRLRRSVYESDGDSSGHRLRFRHRVRGHWRHFYCPSRGLPVGDPGAYRYRYVNAFVRGPADGPLVESERVAVL